MHSLFFVAAPPKNIALCLIDGLAFFPPERIEGAQGAGLSECPPGTPLAADGGRRWRVALPGFRAASDADRSTQLSSDYYELVERWSRWPP